MRGGIAIVLGALLSCVPVFGTPLANLMEAKGSVNIEGLSLAKLADWTLLQEANEASTLLFEFTKGEDAVNFYVKKDSHLNMRSIFVNGSTVLKSENPVTANGLTWTSLSTVRHVPFSRFAPGQTNYVFAFMTQVGGVSYYGYSKSHDQITAERNGRKFLKHLSAKASGTISERSLTGAGFTGKKYYLGWGTTNGSSSNDEMENEVKYDVQHTNDVFTKDAGGNYLGTELIGDSVTPDQIQSAWQTIGGQMTANDMYLQYSSGHGDDDELLVGVTYDQIRDNALAYPAKEIIIFTMACDSGGLVNAFNDSKSVWQNWGTSGRTLMVMSSSEQDEESSTGPGTDPDQPNGPDGSAGSAFGHALWKALIGYADGYVDGVKDGFISLGEIQKYTSDDCANNYGQHPQTTGVYDTNLQMAKVPSKELVEQIERSTPGITPAQLSRRLQVLQDASRVN